MRLCSSLTSEDSPFEGALPSSWSLLALTQRCSVLSWIPSSLATSVAGLPDDIT